MTAIEIRINAAVRSRAPDMLGVPESDIQRIDITNGVVVLWNHRKVPYPSEWNNES